MNKTYSINLPKEFSEVIGQITINWSGLELVLQQLLIKLIRADKRYGGAVISHISPKAINDLILVILKEECGENGLKYKALILLIEATNRLLTERNHIVHGLWFYNLDDQHSERLVFKRNAMNTSPVIFTLEKLIDIRDEIERTEQELHLEINKLGLDYSKAP